MSCGRSKEPSSTLFRWTSTYCTDLSCFCYSATVYTNLQHRRYEIANGDAAWGDAEKKIRDSVGKGRSAPNLVSVKSSAKRKAAETARDIYEKEIGSKEKKRIKKGTEGRR
jgi:hypothetical protein